MRARRESRDRRRVPVAATPVAATPVPPAVEAHPVLSLQRSIGNQAVGHLLERDLPAGSPAADLATRAATPAAILATPGRTAELDRVDPFTTWLKGQAREAAGRRLPPPPPEAVVPGDRAQ